MRLRITSSRAWPSSSKAAKADRFVQSAGSRILERARHWSLDDVFPDACSPAHGRGFAGQNTSAPSVGGRWKLRVRAVLGIILEYYGRIVHLTELRQACEFEGRQQGFQHSEGARTTV